MKKFYSCRYDKTFKEVFLNPKNEDLLKALLEDILKVKIHGLIKNIQIIQMIYLHIFLLNMDLMNQFQYTQEDLEYYQVIT